MGGPDGYMVCAWETMFPYALGCTTNKDSFKDAEIAAWFFSATFSLLCFFVFKQHAAELFEHKGNNQHHTGWLFCTLLLLVTTLCILLALGVSIETDALFTFDPLSFFGSWLYLTLYGVTLSKHLRLWLLGISHPRSTRRSKVAQDKRTAQQKSRNLLATSAISSSSSTTQSHTQSMAWGSYHASSPANMGDFSVRSKEQNEKGQDVSSTMEQRKRQTARFLSAYKSLRTICVSIWVLAAFITATSMSVCQPMEAARIIWCWRLFFVLAMCVFTALVWHPSFRFPGSGREATELSVLTLLFTLDTIGTAIFLFPFPTFPSTSPSSPSPPSASSPSSFSSSPQPQPDPNLLPAMLAQTLAFLTFLLIFLVAFHLRGGGLSPSRVGYGYPGALTDNSLVFLGSQPWVRVLLVPSSQAFFLKFCQVHNCSRPALAMLDLFRLRNCILREAFYPKGSEVNIHTDTGRGRDSTYSDLRALAEGFSETFLDPKSNMLVTELSPALRTEAFSLMHSLAPPNPPGPAAAAAAGNANPPLPARPSPLRLRNLMTVVDELWKCLSALLRQHWEPFLASQASAGLASIQNLEEDCELLDIYPLIGRSADGAPGPGWKNDGARTPYKLSRGVSASARSVEVFPDRETSFLGIGRDNSYGLVKENDLNDIAIPGSPAPVQTNKNKGKISPELGGDSRRNSLSSTKSGPSKNTSKSNSRRNSVSLAAGATGAVHNGNSLRVTADLALEDAIKIANLEMDPLDRRLRPHCPQPSFPPSRLDPSHAARSEMLTSRKVNDKLPTASADSMILSNSFPSLHLLDESADLTPENKGEDVSIRGDNPGVTLTVGMEHLEQGHGGSCPETDRAISCISMP
eukprot:g60519.t1